MSGLKSNLALGKSIGKGHHGEVFLAIDDVHGEVAAKVLSRDPSWTLSQWNAHKDGLLKEGQNLKNATHTNIVKVHYLAEDETSDEIHLVMDYCSGGSLQKQFEAGPLSLSKARKVITEVTLGLHALHSRGMLHRDIKPGNLLLNDEGVAQLGDFGLVTDDLILGYGSQAGYFDHLAPEVWNGGGTSTKTDIWALGMTLYRLLNGLEWYLEYPKPREIVKTGGLANSLKWLPHIPKKWRRVVKTMLRDDSNQRYQGANEIMAAIANLPIEPDWSCIVTADEIRWERQHGTRRIIVVWRRHSARKHDWEAWSEPIQSGIRRTLGGSKGIVSRIKTIADLETFFS